MNVQRIKALTWLGSLLVGSYLGYYVVGFLREKGALEQGVTQEEQREVLRNIEEPEPPKDDLVDYKLVTSTFHGMNWTGEVVYVPVEVDPEDQEPAEAPKTPVADLLQVQFVQVDTDAPAGSLAWVKFLDGKLVARARAPRDSILRIGTRLFEPYQDVRVEAITGEGVHFAFDDEEREPEIVPPTEFSDDAVVIVAAGPDGAVMPVRESSIPVRENYPQWRPERSQQIGTNDWQVGTETLEELNDDYSRILSQDLQYRTHRDPHTGQVAGIMVTKVAPSSLPAQHGLQPGEVLKSINGHKVTSVNDAIAYVKQEAETTDVWTALFEKQGLEFTRTYRSPE